MEMNMHLPQNILAETELRHLAAIPYQMISPSGNSPVIGIYQDSLLGSFRFTRPNIKLTPREVMNLLMLYTDVDVNAILDNKEQLTSFDVLSQILGPLTLKYQTKLFDENEDASTSNNILEIKAGKYIRGQIEKSVLGASTKGIIHRMFNDFGPMAAANFIDDLQNIINEYMKSSSFSVGVSDLIANKKTQDQIIRIISDQKMEVQTELEKLHLGIFENDTSNTNMVQFETNINNILNKATEQAGKEGRKSLNKDNRFLMIVNSGSKGNLVNISQMISCVGQTNVDGKRISYGFNDRTLPHYKKFDDSPSARGFIENSYISGLTAPELFFHAMGGRIGLIDTAVKSVTWETPIVIIENDKPKYIEIGKWIDEQLDNAKPEDVQHFTERRMELMNTDSVYIPTTDEDGIVTWGEITAITRHDPGTELYEIKTSGGRSVIVTESKSLLIWNPETKKLKEMLTPDIKVGDCVPVTEVLCKPPMTIDMIPMKGFYNDIFELNEKNGIFVGLFLAKGEIIENTIKIDTEQGNVTEFLSSVNMNSSVFEYLAELLENELHIPTEAYIASDDFIIGLLNGYYSENGIIESKSIVVKSTSKRLLEGINMLCSRLGIFGKIEQDNMLYVLSISSRWGEIFSNTITLLDDAKQTSIQSVNWEYEPPFKTYNNIVLDEIVEINILDTAKYPKVYDLTIPSTLNFGLANGLQVRDTSTTGYIQRRLIKGLEDLKVEYDMTVRNNRGKIIQFKYGDDGFDSTKAENQVIPLVGMSVEDVYLHYDIAGINDDKSDILRVYTKGAVTRMKKQKAETMKKTKAYIDKMLDVRELIVKNIFKYKNENTVKVPVAFQNIIANVQGQLGLNSHSITDITPLEAFELIEDTFETIKKLIFAPPTPLFEILYYYYLSPRELLVNKRFHRKGLQLLLETIVLKYKQALVHPGEMVGVIAGQSIGEPTTQLTLNSVTYETEIVVRNQRKEIKKVQIGDFVKEHIEKSKQIQYMEDKDTTYAELSDLEEYYEVPSANEEGHTLWTRIEAVTKHPVINEDGTDTMLKLTTKGCREVIVTRAKSCLQLIDGKIQGIDSKDLKVGDYLPVSKKPLEYEYMYELDICNISNGTKNTLRLDDVFGYLIGSYCSSGYVTDKNEIILENVDTEYVGSIQSLCDSLNIVATNDQSNNICIDDSYICKIIKHLCVDKEGNKCVSDKVVFSNPDCILGFMKAYIGINQIYSNTIVNVSSISKTLLTDVMVMLKNMDIVASIYKENATGDDNTQYCLIIQNSQLDDKAYLTVPNKINGETVMEARNDRMPDILFDEIVSIEEVPNTTPYAYDLTVEITRNFDCYNGLCENDTFHMAGVAAKSNVTRGVPRIEEILRLTDNPKNPSLTIHLKPIDELDKDRATVYANMLEHTRLVDVVKSIQICFDPLERSSFMEEDKAIIDQYYEFEDMLRDCMEDDTSQTQKSKWIIRMELDAETLLDKNITMDDVHFAIKNVNPDIHCVYSDYNDSNLVFRIRMNSDSFKKKKGATFTLDQSDEIYLLKNFQDNLLYNIVLRGVHGIDNVLPRKVQNMVVKEEGKYVRKDIWLLDTTGTNLLDVLGTDFIDSTRTYGNDIQEIFDILGIEAARQIIFNEFVEVMEFSDVYINYHHLSLLCDRMTVTQKMVAIFRSGLHNDNIGPIAKATFEVHTEILLNAARHADFDEMRGVSANVMCGQHGYYGTGAFNVILDMKEITKFADTTVTIKDDDKEIERMFGKMEDNTQTCATNSIIIRNNISAIQTTVSELCQDNYDMGF